MALCFAVNSIECYCNHCEDVSANFSCTLKEEGKCFAFVELDSDGHKLYTFGCFPPGEGSILQVNGRTLLTSLHYKTSKNYAFILLSRVLNRTNVDLH